MWSARRSIILHPSVAAGVEVQGERQTLEQWETTVPLPGKQSVMKELCLEEEGEELSWEPGGEGPWVDGTCREKFNQNERQIQIHKGRSVLIAEAPSQQPEKSVTSESGSSRYSEGSRSAWKTPLRSGEKAVGGLRNQVIPIQWNQSHIGTWWARASLQVSMSKHLGSYSTTRILVVTWKSNAPTHWATSMALKYPGDEWRGKKQSLLEPNKRRGSQRVYVTTAARDWNSLRCVHSLTHRPSPVEFPHYARHFLQSCVYFLWWHRDIEMMPQALWWLRCYIIWGDGATGMCLLPCVKDSIRIVFHWDSPMWPVRLPEPDQFGRVDKTVFRNTKLRMAPNPHLPSEFFSTFSEVPSRPPGVWLPRDPPDQRDGLKDSGIGMISVLFQFWEMVQTTWRSHGEQTYFIVMDILFP